MGDALRTARILILHRSMFRMIGALATIMTTLMACTALPALAGPAATAATDYAGLLEWQFSETTTPLPDGGVSFSRDTAKWTLKSGTFRQMRPTSEGAVTGLIFEGQGRFRMTIPDKHESGQLYRYPDLENSDTIELTFSRMVLRTPEGLVAELAGDPPDGGFASNSLAKQRHERWLRYARLDADSRVITGLLTPGDEYLLVDMEADGPGWVMYEFDALLYEEVSLCRLRDTNDHQEYLVSLDRIEDCKPDGSPGKARHNRIDVTHVNIVVSLDEHGGRTGQEIAQGLTTGRVSPVTWVNAEIRFKPLTENARAVSFFLHSWAKVFRVTDGGGNILPFMRDFIGDRFKMVHYNAHDGNLVVLFDEPLERDKEYSVSVLYGQQTLNQFSGRAWYPVSFERINDHHTAKITVLHPKKLDPYGMGEKSGPVLRTKDGPKPEGSGGLKLSGKYMETTFTLDEPTLITAFTYGVGFKEEPVEVDGLPPIKAFGKSDGATIGSVQKNNAADVANSLNFYQFFLDTKLDSDLIRISRAAGYNASHQNFMIFGAYTYTYESPGLSSLLRGTETAYQLWGHQVNWSSYRDQWLAVALPQYMAMLFIETTMPEDDHFEEILEVYGNEQISSQASAMSRFATGLKTPNTVSPTLFFSSGINGGTREYELALLPHALDLTRWGTQMLEKLGPISGGFRSSPAEVPLAHSIFNARRGVIVLHMLRNLLKNSPAGKERDLFREILSTFYKESAGKEVSAEDFINTVERVTQADWDWYFDQWVYGTGLPTLSWNWDAKGKADANGRHPLHVEITKTNVPADFKVFVPLKFDFGGDRWSEILLPVTEAHKTFDIPLPAKPKKVELNPRMSCLAKIEEGK